MLFVRLVVLFICLASLVGLLDASVRGDLVLVSILSVTGAFGAGLGVVLESRHD